MDEICIHCTITGRVQGVWYRASTQQKAKELGLTGWVRNTKEGHVEAVICGKRTSVNDLEQWLWQGPQHANVTNVETKEHPYKSFDNFTVKKTT